jgi:hypothetical protein
VTSNSKLANKLEQHTDPLQLKRDWKGRLVNGTMRALIVQMAAMVMISGAKASSITLAEAITDSGDSTKIALIVEKGKPSGSYEPGTQVVVSADDSGPGAQFASWTGDVEILANPGLSVTTATIPFTAVKITATYTDAATTNAASAEKPAAPTPTPAPAASLPMVADRSWGG